ncbi:MAG: alpha/beta fold hydrolase [Myxococcales bacterium]|nr:alpha/beta fold hydrolase [Myxococcales bacterium]
MVKRLPLLVYIFCAVGWSALAPSSVQAKDRFYDVRVKVRCNVRVILPTTFRKGSNTPILLAVHGYGMTHEDFGTMLRRYFGSFVIVIPEAPHVHIDKHDAQKSVYAWFAKDRYVENLKLAMRVLQRTLTKVESDLQLERSPVIVMGYSQGGAVAIAGAGYLHRRVSAVITYGGWLTVHQEGFIPLSSYRGMKVLIARGERDKRLTVEVVNRSIRLLRSGGAKVTQRVFPRMLHRPFGAQLTSVAEWANDVVRHLRPRFFFVRRPPVLVGRAPIRPGTRRAPSLKSSGLDRGSGRISAHERGERGGRMQREVDSARRD